MIIPIGLDETRLARVPWVSIVVLALNVLVFAAMALGHGEDVVEARYGQVVAYWQEHPYLELPAAVGERLGITAERLSRLTRTRIPASAPAGAEALQAELDALCAELLDALERLPERRWSLVPARGVLQPGWLTHQFLHGGLGHLLGNMLVFALVVAPFLEDVWGRPFFLAFYLTGGVVAGMAQALPDRASHVAILGASGAISACLGAFALRFAHRRVKLWYWLFLFLRGSFFVPAWAYAFFGLALDLLGLKLNGTAGGVAYAAHVGGFVFGLGVAVAVRATGLEDRLAPEGAARWGRTLAASRAEDALAAGNSAAARGHLEAAVAADRGDEASARSLVRLHLAAFDRAAATSLVDGLLAARLSRGDEAGARELLAEFADGIEPELLRPSTAYRAAALAADPALADRLDAAAARGGGALAAKALLRAAERAHAAAPERARDLAISARDAEGAPPELRARADALARACVPSGEATPAAAPDRPLPAEDDRIALGLGPAPRAAVPPAAAGLAAALDPDAPVRLVHCRLLGATAAGLDLATEEGKRAILPPARVAAVAGAVIAELSVAGRAHRNVVVLDLLLHPRPGDRHRTVLRLRGHEMALAAIHPGAAPRDAYGLLVDGLLRESGATAAPSPGAAAGRPFVRFGDPAAFEAAAWGRALRS